MKNKFVPFVKHPEKISSYFKLEWLPLTIVTITGILYNAGMVAGPYFEGQLAQCLFDIYGKNKTFYDMLALALVYIVVIAFVQAMRCIKRFYVRRFANDTSRNMRHMVYNSMIHKSAAELSESGDNAGSLMTKAVSDVNVCSEGMRKFTTEVFDTGVVLVAYLCMMFSYDWKLTLLSCLFIPVAYILANLLKKPIYKFTSAFRKSASGLAGATYERLSGALLYRIYGRDEAEDEKYESLLSDYEKKSVAANIWENSMQPVYLIVSMAGAVFVIYYGARNVAGTGFTAWNIAAFTTFLSCFAKMATKASKAAKLFNSVQKAQVSWKRIKPFMEEYKTLDTSTDIDFDSAKGVDVEGLSFSYPGGPELFGNITFSASLGDVVGVTGPVACGKSTFGKLFLGDLPYRGSVKLGGRELAGLSPYERTMMISYMGHEPQLMSDTIYENVTLGDGGDIAPILSAVRFDEDIREMPDGADTFVGGGGVRLSGGQQARIALARTLYHRRGLIILDDPFSAVDMKTEREIFGELKKLAKDSVVVIISHRIGLFPDLDKVIMLERGVASVGSHDELMRDNAAYRELYSLQSAAAVKPEPANGERERS